VLTHYDRLKGLFETGRISYVNIPMQSGSQRILDLMNRRYAVAEVREKVLQLRAAAPETRFCTHIMINFPAETEADFTASLALADVFETAIFLNYSDNRGTAAAGIYPKVSDEERRKRLDLASDYVNRRGPGGGAVISDFDCDLPYNVTRGAGG
jgi:tRNA-2-methylthio-N6-dimethylallyladenosine synthase